MVNTGTKFEVSILLITKIGKATQKLENGVVWIVRGHSRSFEIATFDTAHTSASAFFYRYSAEALVGWGGKTKQKNHFIAYFLTNISAKNYQNRFVCQSYSKTVTFFRHSVLAGTYNLLYKLTFNK